MFQYKPIYNTAGPLQYISHLPVDKIIGITQLSEFDNALLTKDQNCYI